MSLFKQLGIRAVFPSRRSSVALREAVDEPALAVLRPGQGVQHGPVVVQGAVKGDLEGAPGRGDAGVDLDARAAEVGRLDDGGAPAPLAPPPPLRLVDHPDERLDVRAQHHAHLVVARRRRLLVGRKRRVLPDDAKRRRGVEQRLERLGVGRRDCRKEGRDERPDGAGLGLQLDLGHLELPVVCCG